MYYVITPSEDGATITFHTKESLQKRLEEEREERDAPPRFVTAEWFAKNRDPDYWPDRTLMIIKGELVVPQPKTIVETYDVP